MGLNLKMCEVMQRVDYMPDFEAIESILKDKKQIRDYAFIKHDKDEGVEPHWHIAIRFKGGQNTDYVAKWFDIQPQFVGRVKGKWVDIVKYLTHENAPEKFQYPVSEVFCNFDYVETINAKTIGDYIDMIDKGEIREYNQFDKIPIEMWARNKTVIKNSLEFYKERIAMDKNRSIDVMFINGASGSGKTTYAKKWCEDPEQNYSYCVSSSSNDVLQDYKGEDVLILDDLRDDSFSFADILKVLDNHTASSVKSRYNNKHFLGHTIIITSCLELKDWYKYESREDRIQLYRRITLMLKMKKHQKGRIDVFTWNFDRYKYVHSIDNKYYLEERAEVNRVLSKFGCKIEETGVETEAQKDLEFSDSGLKYVDDELPF